MHLAEFPVAPEQSRKWKVKDIDYHKCDNSGTCSVDITDILVVFKKKRGETSLNREQTCIQTG